MRLQIKMFTARYVDKSQLETKLQKDTKVALFLTHEAYEGGRHYHEQKQTVSATGKRSWQSIQYHDTSTGALE